MDASNLIAFGREMKGMDQVGLRDLRNLRKPNLKPP
jgi:hypothetical protein